MTKPIAVVTGASRGIGRAIAIRLSGDYDIVAVARSAENLQTLAREIADNGGSCLPRVADVADPDAIAAALSGVEARVLINNAGVGPNKPFLDLTREEWRRMVDVNFNALYDVTRLLLPGMIARRSGHIVMIGSISGRSAFVGGTCYAATKHAVMAFTECLMLEVRDAGVKVSVVNPGSVATEFSPKGDTSWMLAPEEVAEAVAQVLATPPDVLIHRVEIRALSKGGK
jgi:3-oxoacyl-[acyl-carrier protein] reductase